MSEWQSRPRRQAGLVVLAFLLSVFALLEFVNHQHFAQNHESTIGTVFKDETRCMGPTCHRQTTVRFVTAAGQTRQHDFFDAEAAGQVGEMVTVYYSVDDPEYAQLTEGWSFGSVVVIAMCIFIWLCVIGNFIWVSLTTSRLWPLPSKSTDVRSRPEIPGRKS